VRLVAVSGTVAIVSRRRAFCADRACGRAGQMCGAFCTQVSKPATLLGGGEDGLDVVTMHGFVGSEVVDRSGGKHPGDEVP